MSKVVAPSIRNSQFQRIKEGDAAVLFFREDCPFCKDFKPTWNRVARELKRRWNRGSLVYDGDMIESRNQSNDSEVSDESRDTVKFVEAPHVVKVDIVKFPAIKNRIHFPTVPCIALYKRGEPVVFFTSQDRSLPNVLSALENYYIRAQLPPQSDYVVGDQDGSWPQEKDGRVPLESPVEREDQKQERENAIDQEGEDQTQEREDQDQEVSDQERDRKDKSDRDQDNTIEKIDFPKMGAKVSKSKGGKTRNEFYMSAKKSDEDQRHKQEEKDDDRKHRQERKSAYEKLRKKEKEYQEKLKREEAKKEKLREEIVRREKMLLEERRKVKQVEPDLEELKRRREQSLQVKHQKKFEEAVAASAQKQAQRIIEEERKKIPDEQESFARFLALLLKLKGELK